MRVVIQRVAQAGVTINDNIRASIGKGLLVLAGFEEADTREDMVWLSNKIVNLRIFDDAEGVMNIPVKENGGDILIVSQFTLHASTKKGNRPSYIRAARPEAATVLYDQFVQQVSRDLGKTVHTGEFGADMKVSLVNDGPVTIVIDTKNRE